MRQCRLTALRASRLNEYAGCLEARGRFNPARLRRRRRNLQRDRYHQSLVTAQNETWQVHELLYVSAVSVNKVTVQECNWTGRF